MGLGSISRRSDAWLACVGRFHCLARPQSRHAALFGSHRQLPLMATGQDVQPNGHDPPGLPGLGWGNTCASSLPVENAERDHNCGQRFFAVVRISAATSRRISELRLYACNANLGGVELIRCVDGGRPGGRHKP